MLFAAVIVVERRDGPHRQRDSDDDDDGDDDGNSAYREIAVFAKYYLPPDRGDNPASGADVQRTLKRCSLGRLTRVCSVQPLPRNTQSDTQTAECATFVAVGRVYGLHAMRADNNIPT